MGAIFNPTAPKNAAQQAGLFHARKRNRLAVATVDSLVAPAYGTITFPSNPANLATITIGGTVITFVTGTPSGPQVKIGAGTNATILALLAFLASNPISSVVVSGGGTSILVQSVLPADTTVTLAASAATVSSGNLVPQTVRARQNANSIGVQS